jgi:hypothetical protein
MYSGTWSAFLTFTLHSPPFSLYMHSLFCTCIAYTLLLMYIQISPVYCLLSYSPNVCHNVRKHENWARISAFIWKSPPAGRTLCRCRSCLRRPGLRPGPLVARIYKKAVNNTFRLGLYLCAKSGCSTRIFNCLQITHFSLYVHSPYVRAVVHSMSLHAELTACRLNQNCVNGSTSPVHVCVIFRPVFAHFRFFQFSNVFLATLRPLAVPFEVQVC